jgi:methylthioribose-1-phosphate isomerase
MALPHPAPLSGTNYSAAELLPGDDAVVLLDQRQLPREEIYLEFTTVAEIARAISEMVVRGAPAIGITGAYGMELAARDPGQDLEQAGALLISTRPTAVNLAWAVTRMLKRVRELGRPSRTSLVEALALEARAIHREDVASCRRMGALGAERIPDDATVLTHCNAGALATGGYGSALGVIRAALGQGKRVRVLADETRPYWQGARLTAWELARDGIPVEVITDNSAAHFFSLGTIDLAIVGADRIARNGDVANKIGTYGVACLCHLHQRPLYVAAPWSTVDEGSAQGSDIPIEQRPAREVTHAGAMMLVPAGVGVRNPAFDVTPARLVRAIFTERGVIEPVGPKELGALIPSDRARE